MKIKKFQIDHYGPLGRQVHESLDSFNLFFGPNESGKSLTIDGLVKLLLGKEAKQFSDIDRVDQKPEGYVVLEIDNKEVKLSGKKTLVDQENFSGEQAENIFIIRNSELSIAKDVKEEMGFYTSVTDQLTGLKTDEIKRVIKMLEKKAKITHKRQQFSNTDEDKKLRDRMKNAKTLIKQIEKLEKEIESNQAELLEEKWMNLKIKLRELEERRELMEKARKKKKLAKAKKALEELKKAEKKLATRENFNQKGLQKWQNLDWKMKSKMENKLKIEQQIEKLSAEVKNTENELKEINLQLETSRKRVEEIEDNQDTFQRAKELNQRFEARKQFSQLGTGGLVISALLLTGLFIGQVMNSWLIGFGLMVFIVSIITKIGIQLTKAKLERNKARLIQIITKFGLKGESLNDVLSAFQSIKENYEQLEKQENELETKEGILDQRIDEKNEEAKEIDKKREQTESKIVELQKKSGLETWQEYQQKVKEKQGWQTQREKTIERLASVSEIRPDKNNFKDWRRIVEQWNDFNKEGIDVDYSEEDFDKLKEKIKETAHQIADIEEKIDYYQEQVGEVGSEANKILDPFLDYQLHSEAIADLPIILEELVNFRKEHLKKKNLAGQAIAIFNQISKDEKSKVGELFGKKSLVSQYFRKITDGKYRQVFFDQENNRISVEENQGDSYGADKLSGGAFDQLYLAIRLALGEKLLGKEKGFFIMDDPFIKADWQRLPRLLDILQDISASGWQILYFSTKKEVKDALSEDISSGKIKFFEV